MRAGKSVESVNDKTGIDPWFLHGIKKIVNTQDEIVANGWPLSESLMSKAEVLGFSDHHIEKILNIHDGDVRKLRSKHNIQPHFVQIDTLAAEFPARTNYMYSTYQSTESENRESSEKKILVLGSGVYRIGSSVEFDWCCVNAVRAISELGHETIMLNYNPETVSTDYDECDRLVFDEISFERVLDVCESEQPDGIVVSMGGQIANNLAIRLHRAGVPILGTAPENIDRAEDRQKFSSLLRSLRTSPSSTLRIFST